jgi:hypothetical protein
VTINMGLPRNKNPSEQNLILLSQDFKEIFE